VNTATFEFSKMSIFLWLSLNRRYFQLKISKLANIVGYILIFWIFEKNKKNQNGLHKPRPPKRFSLKLQ
jgi:hypothetical protein